MSKTLERILGKIYFKLIEHLRDSYENLKFISKTLKENLEKS